MSLGCFGSGKEKKRTHFSYKCLIYFEILTCNAQLIVPFHMRKDLLEENCLMVY